MSRLSILLVLALAATALAPALAADSGKPNNQPAKEKDPPGLIHMSPEQQKTIDLKTATAEREQISEPLRLPGTVTFDPGHVALLARLARRA